jgi:Amidohydrolase family
VPAIIDEAHKNGLRVSGHIPAFMTAEQCVKLGYNEIQHVNFLFLNFYPDVKDTRTPARFIAVAERAADLDFNSAKVRAFIQLLHDRNIVSDPTVNAFETMFIDRAGKVAVAYAAVADRLPPQIRRAFLTGGLPVTQANDQRYRDSSRALLNMVKALYDSGVTIVAGTDNSAFALPHELELYVQAGIPAPKVLQLDTIGAARVMHRDDKLGSIKAGKLADLILVDGDPTTNISDVRKLESVMKDGVLYIPAEINRAIGIKNHGDTEAQRN